MSRGISTSDKALAPAFVTNIFVTRTFWAGAIRKINKCAIKEIKSIIANVNKNMEAAPQLKGSGLDGDYRILADFGGTVLAGTPSKYGVQFVTWDWDYDRTGVSHGHYFMENYDKAFASMKKRYAGCEPS